MRETIGWRIAADKERLPGLEAAVREWTARSGLSERDAVHVDLVVEELVTNVIFHGRRRSETAWIELCMERNDEQLAIRVTDNMEAFDPFAKPPPDLTLAIEDRPIGGLGIHFVRTLTDTWRYERSGDLNIVSLRKRLTPDLPANDAP